MSSYDAVFIGTGHNALVAAAYLARAGWSVLMLERNDRAGGFVRTDELTLPGFLHDTYASAHPLFVTSPVYAELGPDLAARGRAATAMRGQRCSNSSAPTPSCCSGCWAATSRQPRVDCSSVG